MGQCGGDSQQVAAAGEALFLGAVGQEAEVADELFRRQGHRLRCAAGFAVAVGEGDLAIFDRKNPVV